MKQLSKKEKNVLEYIVRVTAEKGYAPSVRDIAAALNYKSTSTVQLYLDRLLACGALLRESGKSRSLRVNPEFSDFVSDLSGSRRIPVIGASGAHTAVLHLPVSDGTSFFLRRAGENAFGIDPDAWLLCREGNGSQNNGLFLCRTSSESSLCRSSDTADARSQDRTATVFAILDRSMVSLEVPEEN